MKLLLALCISISLFITFSCETTEIPELETNFQFTLDEEVFQTSDVIAYLNDDELEIYAEIDELNRVEIYLSSSTTGIYDDFSLIGNDRFLYEKDGLLHSSSNTISDQTEVTLQSYDTETNLISGTFFANPAVNIAVPSVELSLGEFTDIPVEKHPFNNYQQCASATVDGVDVSSIMIGVSSFLGTRTILINYDNDGDTAQIQLKLDEDIEPGIYTSSPDAKGDLLIGNEGYTSTGDDQFEITLHDKFFKVIEGTFSFTSTNIDFSGETVEVTNGKFMARY